MIKLAIAHTLLSASLKLTQLSYMCGRDCNPIRQMSKLRLG